MDTDLAILRAFEDRHAGPYERAGDAAPPWTDGSIIASLLAILRIEGLVHNGAWASVCYNRTCWAVPIAIPGYEAIGAPQHAAIAREAVEAVARAEAMDPAAVDDSDEWLADRLMELAGDALEALDDRWIAAEAREEVYRLMAAFIVEKTLLGKGRDA